MHHDIASRKQQAQKIHKIISDFLGKDTFRNLRIIEVGCGTGEISAFFAEITHLIWGIEIDISNLLKHQTSFLPNLAFSHANGANLPFKDESFDIVLFPQVYEHTTQQQAVINDIYRILKPGGICFFSGPNRFQIIEPHYFLPFLSWLPHFLSNFYLKLTKKGVLYDIYPRNYWRLKKMTKAFQRFDYTAKLIKNPEKFGLEIQMKSQFINSFPIWFIKSLAPFFPNYNWILQKQLNNIHTPEQEIYDDFYFKYACGGHEEFLSSQGDELSPWMDHALNLAKLKAGERVLDLGTGRGEIAMQANNLGCLSIGLDYSMASMHLAKSLRNKTNLPQNPFNLTLSDARHLPFKSRSFDVIFMLDIVEHLSQEDLLDVLNHVFEVLAPKGRLIIHTMPNKNYYKWAYPLYRFIMQIIGKSLPKDPRLRFYHGECHVNIQTPKSLRENLRSAGFKDIQIILTQLSGSFLKKFLCRIFPFKYVLANDIIAIVKKNKR